MEDRNALCLLTFEKSLGTSWSLPSGHIHLQEYKHGRTVQEICCSVDLLQVPKDRVEVLTILGDTKDPKYPIWRSGSDQIYTLCTAFFDLQEETVEIIFDNPKTGLPATTLNLQLRDQNHRQLVY